MKKANARLQKALQKFKDSQSRRFEPRRSVANAVITSVERDSVTGHTTGIVRATIDGIPDQNVFVGSGQGFSIGSVVRVENRGGSFAPDWTLIGRVGSVAGAEGTLDIDRTLSTPTGVILSTDAYTPVAGAGIFSSVTVTFNQNQDYESVAAYDIQWFKDSEGASTAQIISVPHVVGQATNLAVVGGLLPSSISVSQSYSFRVRARAYSGAVGGWAEYSAIETAADPTAPSTPTGLSAVAIDDYTLRLYWTANSEPDFSYYVLDVSANGGTAGRLTGYPRTVGNQNEFILGVTPNVSRYFAVKAVDATGNESSYSSFAGPFKTENLPSDAGLFYFGPTIELVANLTNAALTMDVNFNILEAGWFVHLVAPNGTNEIVQINTSSPGGSTVSNGDGYRYNIVRAQGGTTAQAFTKGTIGHALTTAGFIQSDVREGVSNTPTIRMWEWDDPYTDAWADKTLRVALGNLGGITDPVLGSLSGYGLYSDNVYLTGQIIAQGGAILGSLEIDGGDIIGGGGAVTINDDGITIVPGDSVVNKIVWNNGTFNTAEIVALVDTDQQEIHSRARQYDNSDTVIAGIEATDSIGVYYASVQAFFDGASHARLGAYSVISGLKSFVEASYESGVGYVTLDPGLGGEVLLPRGVHTDGNIWADSSGLNIGTVSQPFNALYVNSLYADSIVGTPSGLEIGVDVQAWDADLDAIAGLAKSDGNFIVGNGTTWVAESGATARASLGLTIGTHVQAWDADLDAIAALAKTDSNFIVGNGTTWVAESGATARTSIGLGTTSTPTFAGLTINGNIAVTGTVDGVDVSAHKSRHESGGADAINHDSLTGFVANEHIDHTAVAITAGNGLTGGGTIASSRTLNVGAGNGISVAADSVAVNQAYDFTWTGLHTFDNHTEMDSVDVNGALAVFDDLSVFHGGFYPLFVNVDTVNPNNSNVGIMTNSPDPQFALDVAGPLRAQYLIGPHAIQLSDAALIAHFDGPYPFETNFDGFAAGHLGQVATETGGVIYRPGKFGKAVQLAEATTNLVTNPRMNTLWGAYGTPTTRELSTAWSYVGTSSIRLVGDGAGDGAALSAGSLTSGTTYTLSAHIKRVSGTPTIAIVKSSSPFTVYGQVQWSGEAEKRMSVTFTMPSTEGCNILLLANNGEAYFDAVQLEQKAYATPYCDGSLGTGHTWAGTAHASTSSRTAGYLTYPITNVSANSWTMMTWVNSENGWNNSGAYGHYLSLYGVTLARVRVYTQAGNTNGLVIEWIDNTGTTRYSTLGSVGKLNANRWHHLAFVYNGTVLSLYIDGVFSGSSTLPIWASDPSTLLVGKDMFSSNVVKSVLFDDLVILSRAADAAEIRAIYESDAPVFAESSIEVWRTPTQVPIWVDSEGMWMRSVGGGETLGAYGGDATKSWGGKTLYQSDFLLGNATDGYIHWHAYQDDADPWGAAGMEVKAQVDITGDSTISGTLIIDGGALAVENSGGTVTYFQVTPQAMYVGGDINSSRALSAFFADDVDLPGAAPGGPQFDAGDLIIGEPTQNHIFWDQSAGRLNFRDASTTKLYLDDGALYAGDGAVKLDETGLSINTATTTTINTFNRVEWLSGGTSAAFIGAYHVSGATSAGVFVSNFTNGNFEIRGNGSSSGTVRLMASSGGVGSIGDGNVFGANIVLNDNGTTESIGFDADIFNFGGGPLSLTEISTTPATPTSGTQMRAYMKADKFVLQFNDGGTVRYKYLLLTGTGTTWVHTTTAP